MQNIVDKEVHPVPNTEQIHERLNNIMEGTFGVNKLCKNTEDIIAKYT